jgi:hypothetical protein
MKNLNFVDGSFLLKTVISENGPFAGGKIGINELRIIHNFINNEEYNKTENDYYKNKESSVFDISKNQDAFQNKLSSIESIDTKIQWNNIIIEKLYMNNGIFPKGECYIYGFLKEIINSIKELNFAANWTIPRLNEFEKKLILNLSPECNLIESRSLESYYSGTPWTEELKNKKVLVISPFVKSIEKQYQKRTFIWKDPRILPDFELITLQHQLNPNWGVPTKYNSWMEMLADIKNKISNIDFDFALIGTGGSSLPIAAHCKKLGKQAIHLGGSLQVLFGITGTRWETKPIIKNFQNEHWTKVLPEETPPLFKQLEDGCYW